MRGGLRRVFNRLYRSSRQSVFRLFRLENLNLFVLCFGGGLRI